MDIDTSSDVRTDTPFGKDPDSHSPTLRRYHKRLWTKPLAACGLSQWPASRGSRAVKWTMISPGGEGL